MAYWAAPFLILSAIGSVYTLATIRAVGRFAGRARPPAAAAEPVALLKPLHGDEPRLHANLTTFLYQDWPASIVLVAGVQRRDDSAAAVAKDLPTRPERAVRVVVDGTRHGANAKVGNLVNIARTVPDDLLILSDSDMSVPADYVATVAATLAEPGVGLVTCVYRGRGDAGAWSRFAAAGISYQFLPSVLLGLAGGMAPPAMGSTIALRRATLDRIGGFEAFADILADDNAMGVAVQALGQRTAVAPVVTTHGCAERSLGAVARHELRWATTIRAINRWNHLGLLATFPVGWACLALPLAPAPAAGLLGVALGVRLMLMRAVDRLVGEASGPWWMLVPRDMLSLAVYLASFAARSVEWRGARLAVRRAGRIAAAGRP